MESLEIWKNKRQGGLDKPAFMTVFLGCMSHMGEYIKTLKLWATIRPKKKMILITTIIKRNRKRRGRKRTHGNTKTQVF